MSEDLVAGCCGGIAEPASGVLGAPPLGYSEWGIAMTPGVIAILIVVGFWVLSCIQYPYVTCKHCEGKKRKYHNDGEHYDHVECFFCYDSGERYRWELRWLTLF